MSGSTSFNVRRAAAGSTCASLTKFSITNGRATRAALAEAERRACEIRLRAERKAGQLLAQTVQHGGSKSRESTLKNNGITKDQSSRWQLARIPQDEFETALADQAVMPSQTATNGKSSGACRIRIGERRLGLWEGGGPSAMLGPAPQNEAPHSIVVPLGLGQPIHAGTEYCIACELIPARLPPPHPEAAPTRLSFDHSRQRKKQQARI